MAGLGLAGQDKVLIFTSSKLESITMEFEKSADAKVLENVLSEAEVGQVITYEQMSAAIGRDVRKYAISALGTARRGLFKEKQFVFAVERGKGLVRIGDAAIVKTIEKDRLHLHRTASKSLKKLSVVKFDNLDANEKKEHTVASAQMGAIAMFSHKNSSKKIESKVNGSSKDLPIGETLKLFV